MPERSDGGPSGFAARVSPRDGANNLARPTIFPYLPWFTLRGPPQPGKLYRGHAGYP